jgi:GH15 family glucan-1,4-alpha-glucosidase
MDPQGSTVGGAADTRSGLLRSSPMRPCELEIRVQKMNRSGAKRSEKKWSPLIRRSAMTVNLLTHAEYDSSVAALSTSLPERRGGDRNCHYRFAWVRDASLSVALLARSGKTEEVQH